MAALSPNCPHSSAVFLSCSYLITMQSQHCFLCVTAISYYPPWIHKIIGTAPVSLAYDPVFPTIQRFYYTRHCFNTVNFTNVLSLELNFILSGLYIKQFNQIKIIIIPNDRWHLICVNICPIYTHAPTNIY